MKKVDKLDDIAIYMELRDIIRIANKAVYEARLENEKIGISGIFSKKGIIYYELPNGVVTTERPKILEKE